MQKKYSIPPHLLYPVLLLALGLLIWLGLQNRPDPVWLEADTLVKQPCLMVEDAADSLAVLYAGLHTKQTTVAARPTDSTAYNLMNKPYSRTMAWSRFRDFCYFLKDNRLTVVSGVTGTGTTKIAEKASRFLATRPDSNFLLIECAPEFDLEYHKKYIGEEMPKGFVQGDLLRFWSKCYQHPKERFVCMIDNFDKINPETFFGPDLWEMLSSPRDTAVIGGKKIGIPPNFHLLSVTHLGPGSRVEFNEEHFKRLGKQYVIEPNAHELLDYYRRQTVDLAKKAKTDSAAAQRLAALVSSSNQRRVVFYFLKTNRLLRKRYGPGFELGQSSNFRKYYLETDLPDLKSTFISHINSIAPTKQGLTVEDFDAMDYTAANFGLEPSTNFFARQINWLSDTGYLVEITMVAATAFLTTFIGWWLLRRRERMIRSYGTMARDIYDEFEGQRINAEAAADQLERIKVEVNDLVLQRKLNYTEGLYFMAYVEDKVRRVEFARNISENFLELFNAFMEDNVLSENEYLKLQQFLQSIWHKIPDQTYEQFKMKVEKAYERSQNNTGADS